MRIPMWGGEAPESPVVTEQGCSGLLEVMQRAAEGLSDATTPECILTALLRAATKLGADRPRAGLCTGDSYSMWSLDESAEAAPCGTAPDTLFPLQDGGIIPLSTPSGSVGILDITRGGISSDAGRALDIVCRHAAHCLEKATTPPEAPPDTDTDFEAWWEAADCDTLVRRALADVAYLCGADSAAVLLPNPHTGAARIAYSDDSDSPNLWHGVSDERRNGQALLRVLRTGERMEFLWNPLTEALKVGILPAGPTEGSWIVVPLVDGNGVFGALDVFSNTPRRFGQRERERLDRAARFLGRLLARMGEAARHADARGRDAILLDAVLELAEQHQARPIAAILARAARQLWPGADLAYAMLPQQEGGLWAIAALESNNPEDDRKGWARAGEGFAGWVIQGRQSLCIAEAAGDPRRGALDQGQGITAGMWVPMRSQEKMLGLMCVASTHSERRYDADDAEALLLLAHQGAAALERAGERHVAEESFWDAIEAISGAIDARDGYTHGHSRNVTEYTVAIATRMGLPPREIQTLRASALLHDIGKIGIPDHILNKPANLTPDERTVMESHPEVGYQILLRAPSLQAILPGVRYHHERPDGKGYPCNLKGEALPLQARIMAVADAFDAMTSDRVYRKRMTVEKAVGILQQGKGAQWDPDCVDHFVALVESRATPRLQLLSAEDSGRQYLPSLGVDVFGA